jgi:CHAT domain-containing protein
MGEDNARDLLKEATSIYVSGESNQAFRLLDEAISKVSVNEKLRADLILQKAGWLRESGHTDDAAKTLDAAAKEVDRLPRSGHEMEWSWLRLEQGLAAQRRGDPKAAEALFAEAEELARQSPAQDVQLTDVFANQASLYLDQGRLSKARNVLLAALKIDQRVGNKRSESNDLNMLGMVYGRLGDPDTSRVYLMKAFEVAFEAGLIREAEHAMGNIAALMDDAGDHADAAMIFQEMGRSQAEAGDKSGVACNVANEGAAAAAAGDLEGAVTLFTRSHELHLAAGNMPHTVQDLLHLSGVEMQRGHDDKALSYAEQALADARKFGLVELLWAAEASVATCRIQTVKSDNYSEGVKALEEAREGYRRAADVVELLRTEVYRPEERESIFTGKEMIYDEAMALCTAVGWGESAFQFSERARMRSFLDTLGSSRLRQFEADDPAADQRAQLVARLLSHETPSSEKPRLMDELRVLRAEIMARRPALAAITEAELPSVDDIRASIPAQTSVLEYFQIEDSVTGNSVALFLLDREGLKDAYSVRLDEPLQTLVQRFRNEIRAEDTDLATGNKLFGLLRPVMPMLKATANLIIVPHRSLHRLPFSALWYQPAGEDAPPRLHLKDRFHLTIIPSASYLSYLTRTAAPGREHGPAVIFGIPTDDRKHAESEARRVAAKLGVTARLGKDATRRAFLEVGAPLVLHIACHGEYDSHDPLLSRLGLADGFVTVEDLLNAGPSPGLLVLSACMTGISERRPGDELIGLAQAALRNGTRSVIATLWETNSDSSVDFFEHFYDALAQGATVSEAMTWGRNAMGGPDGYDQPVDWAPFLLIGDPSQRIVEPVQTPIAAQTFEPINPAVADRQAEQTLAAALDRQEYRIASLAAGELVTYRMRAGRLREALTLAEQEAEYIRRAGLGSWTQLGNDVQRLQVLDAMGQSEQVLAELHELRYRMQTLAPVSDQPEIVEPWAVRETLLDTGRQATMRMDVGRWDEALELSAAKVVSMRSRGAPGAAVTRARFNDYYPLIQLGRLDEALTVLRDCRELFERTHDIQGLGMVSGALANAESERGHLDLAADLERDALRYGYEARDVAGIQASHYNLGIDLLRNGKPDMALPHHLAVALLRAVMGADGTERSINAAAADLATLGDDTAAPASVADLCQRVAAVPGAQLDDLLVRLLPDEQTAQQTLERLIEHARDRARALAASPSPIARVRAAFLAAWDPIIAGLVAADQGDVQAAAAVSDELASAAEDSPELAGALRRILDGDRKQAGHDPAAKTDDIPAAVVGRALGALSGQAGLPAELWQAMGIRVLLGLIVAAGLGDLHAAAEARPALDYLAGQAEFAPLGQALDRILQGERDADLARALTDPASRAVVATVLYHITTCHPEGT